MIRKKSILLSVCLLTVSSFSSTYADRWDSNSIKKCTSAKAEKCKRKSAATLDVAESFLAAAGSGDMDTLNELMTDDFVWHNEGDSELPWIGTWETKDKVLNEFLPIFGSNVQTTSWSTDHSFVNGNQVVFMGTMSFITTNSGVDTGKFSWAARVQVENGKVTKWNWFEDSYAVSKAYHGVK